MSDKAVVLVAADELRRKPSRSEWTVSIRADTLGVNCVARAQYHRERLAWWADETAKVEAQVREDGVELREQQVTGGQRFEAVIDVALSRRLSECKQKAQNHRQAAVEYERWASFLGAMGQVSLTLTREDYHYFQPKPEEAE